MRPLPLETRFAVLAVSWLYVATILTAPSAEDQVQPLLSLPPITADMRSRLAEAGRDSMLAPWQREFMLAMARGNVESSSIEPSSQAAGINLLPEKFAANDGAWTAIFPPSERSFHTAIYDPVRDRMVVFGGWDHCSYNDVWTLSLAVEDLAWKALAPAGNPPPARLYHTAIYDPVRDRMVVFGGSGGNSYSDVWALSLAGNLAWCELTPTGSPPSARFGHTAIYDPVRDRMLVFGGKDDSYLNDVWELSLATSPAWGAIAPAGSPPSERAHHTAIYDPVRDRMLVFGGKESGGSLNDVWELSFATSPGWSAIAPAGSPPSARSHHTAIYDPVGERMLVFGGFSPLNDVWTLSLSGSSAWSAQFPAGNPPSARNGHTAIHDPVRDRMVLFGGTDGRYLNDLWALPFAGNLAWSAIIPAGSPPSAHSGHTAIYDPVHDRMVVFGGTYGTSYLNDVWALSLAGSLAWSALTPAGSPPCPRSFHSAIYDPIGERMVVFGGTNGTGNFSDVWSLSLAGSLAWSELTPEGTPPSARFGHTAIYDPVRNCMVLFGGRDSESFLNDVRTLSLSPNLAWSTLTPAGSPPPVRLYHTAIYDPVRDRIMVFGGVSSSLIHNDVWALSLAGSLAWSEVTPAGSPPSARFGHTAIYDPIRDRMVAFGGYVGSNCRNDPLALSLAGSLAWNALAPAGGPPSAREHHTAIYDRVRDQMVLFGGGDDNGNRRNDVWALWWAEPVSVPGDADPHPRGFNLAPPRPNPSRGNVALEFAMPQPGHVNLAVYDVAGHKVRQLMKDSLDLGRHSVTWDGRDDAGQLLASGIYFCQLRVDGQAVAVKMTVLLK